MTIMRIIKSLPSWFIKNEPMKADAMSALLSAYRIFAGMIILPYGVGKIKSYDKLAENFFNNPVWIGHEVSLIICIFQQVFCAGLLILGIQSRFAAFMLFTNMVVATQVHYFDPFVPTSSLPIICLAMYAFLTLSGGGKFSADNIVFKRERFAGESYSNIGYGLRGAMIFGASALAWFGVQGANMFMDSKPLGFAFGYAILALICIMYGIAIYGFCPFRYMTNKILKK